MTDYGFYTGVYLGSSISEKAFPSLLARAEAELERIKRCCRVKSPGEESEKMALCAMAESLHQERGRQGVQSASVGGVSVRYDNDRKVSARLWEAAGIYLDIYRGVG